MHAVLEVPVEVDHHVAADDEVKRPRGRLGAEIVAAHADPTAHRAGKPPALALPLKIPVADRRRGLRERVSAVHGLRGPLEAPPIDVGGLDEHPLQPPRVTGCGRRLGDEEHNPVGLLARRTAGAPDPDGAGHPGEQAGEVIGGQPLPGLRVPEEPGDVDRDRVLEVLVLRWSPGEQSLVFLVALDPAGAHADGDAAAEALVLVGLEGQAGGPRDGVRERIEGRLVPAHAAPRVSRLARAS